MTVRFPLWLLAALPASLLSISPAPAQSTGLFGGRGPQSSASAGGVRSNTGNYSGFSTTQSNGLANQSMFNSMSTFGQGGGGQTGFGQNAISSGNTGAARTSALNGGLNASGRTSNLGGQGANGVGANGQRGGLQGANGLNGQRSQLGQLGQRNGLGQNGRNGNGRNFNQGNEQDGSNQQMSVRIRPQVSFQHPTRQVTAVNGAIKTRFDRIVTRGSDFGSIQFDVEGSGNVVLRGSVQKEETKRLAAALVRLEPGVRSVTNELNVVPPPPAAGQ